MESQQSVFTLEVRDRSLSNIRMLALLIMILAIATDLWRHMPKENVEQLFTMMPMKSLSQGASTTIVAALDPKLSGQL